MTEQTTRGEEWEDQAFPLVGGLNLDTDSEFLQDTEYLSLKNLKIYKKNFFRDTGYVAFQEVVRGTPRKTVQHVTAAGSINTFLITDATFYIRTSDEWQYISDGVDTTVNSDASGGATSITVADITGFSDADYVGITLDDGTQHKTTINGTPTGTTIVITDALPGSGVVATTGNAFVKAIDLSGSADKHVHTITVPWNDWLVFTNGVDTTKYYDPTTAVVTVIPNLPGSGNTICQSVALFDASIVLINTTEGGTPYPQRVRWSDKADGTNWTTGDAGYVDLLDSEDKNLYAHKLGPYLIVYRENSVARGQAVVSTTQRFYWETTLTEDGVISSAAVSAFTDEHFVVGRKNIYLYKGGFDQKIIGRDVDSLLLGSSAEAQNDKIHKIFTIYVHEEDAILIGYQSTAATANCDKFLRFDRQFEKFTQREFANELTGWGELSDSTGALAWQELTGTWAEQTWKWNSTSIVGTARTLLLCADDLQVYKYDFLSGTDAGTAISVELETKDFGDLHGFTLIDYIELKAGGGTILVEYSTDQGVSWNTYGSITYDATPVRKRKFKQVLGRTIRFRLTSSEAVELHWMCLRKNIVYEW